MRRTTFAIGYLPTFLGLVLGILLSANLAYGFVGPGDSPGSLLAAIANPDRAGNQLPGRMAAMTAAKEMQSYRPISEVLTSRPIGLPTPASTELLPRAASTIVRNNSNRFAIGTVGRNSRAPSLPYRKVLDEAAVATRTLGGVHEEIVEYWINERTTPRGGSHSTGINRAWKLEKELVERTGKGTRSWTVAQAQELLETGKTGRPRIDGFRGHHINSFNQHPEWAGDPRNIKFLTQEEHLIAHGGAWRNPTTGKLIDRKRTLSQFNRAVARRLRDPIVQSRFARTFRMASKSRLARQVIRGAKAVSRFGSTITKTSTKIGRHAVQFVTVAAVGADFALAGYGYYDTATRYQAGQLDHDLMLAKVAVHTGEAGIGGVGVALIFTPEPVTTVAGIIIVSASVVLAAADFSLEMVASGRTRARKELLGRIDREQRHSAVLEKLKRDAAKVHVRGD